MKFFKEIILQSFSDSHSLIDIYDLMSQSNLISLFIRLKSAGLREDDNFQELVTYIIEVVGHRIPYEEYDLRVANLLTYMLVLDLIDAKNTVFREIKQNIEETPQIDLEYDGDLDVSGIDLGTVKFDEEYDKLIGYKP
jgi:hypothetical protein